MEVPVHSSSRTRASWLGYSRVMRSMSMTGSLNPAATSASPTSIRSGSGRIVTAAPEVGPGFAPLSQRTRPERCEQHQSARAQHPPKFVEKG